MDATATFLSNSDVAVRSIHAMAAGERPECDTLYAPTAVDHENPVQPPSSRTPGTAGFWSTALWLRSAFSDLYYDIHQVITDGDLIAVHSTMNGRHDAPIVFYTNDGAVDAAFTPTGRTFAMTQSHWFRVDQGRIIEHWANRDDLGTAKQLHWIPPTPGYLSRWLWPSGAPSVPSAGKPQHRRADRDAQDYQLRNYTTRCSAR